MALGANLPTALLGLIFYISPPDRYPDHWLHEITPHHVTKFSPSQAQPNSHHSYTFLNHAPSRHQVLPQPVNPPQQPPLLHLPQPRPITSPSSTPAHEPTPTATTPTPSSNTPPSHHPPSSPAHEPNPTATTLVPSYKPTFYIQTHYCYQQADLQDFLNDFSIEWLSAPPTQRRIQYVYQLRAPPSDVDCMQWQAPFPSPEGLQNSNWTLRGPTQQHFLNHAHHLLCLKLCITHSYCCCIECGKPKLSCNGAQHSANQISCSVGPDWA